MTIIALTVSFVLVALDRLLGLDASAWLLIALPVGVGLAIAATLAMLARPTTIQALARVDHALRLHDALGSAAAESHTADNQRHGAMRIAFRELTQRRAEKLAPTVHVAQALPITLSGRWSYATGMALIVGLSAWLMPSLDLLHASTPSDGDLAQAEAQDRQAREEVASTIHDVRETLDSAELAAGVEDELARLDNMLAQLDAARTSDALRTEAAGRFDELADRIDEQARDEQRELDAIADEFRALPKPEDGPAESFADALSGNDYENAIESLDQLSRDVEKMDEAQRRQAADQLRSLSKHLQDRAEAPEPGEAQPGGESSEAARELTEQGLSEPDARQLSQLDDAEELRRELEERGFDPAAADRLARETIDRREQAQAEASADDELRDLADTLERAADELEQPPDEPPPADESPTPPAPPSEEEQPAEPQEQPTTTPEPDRPSDTSPTEPTEPAPGASEGAPQQTEQAEDTEAEEQAPRSDESEATEPSATPDSDAVPQPTDQPESPPETEPGPVETHDEDQPAQDDPTGTPTPTPPPTPTSPPAGTEPTPSPDTEPSEGQPAPDTDEPPTPDSTTPPPDPGEQPPSQPDPEPGTEAPDTPADPPDTPSEEPAPEGGPDSTPMPTPGEKPTPDGDPDSTPMPTPGEKPTPDGDPDSTPMPAPSDAPDPTAPDSHPPPPGTDTDPTPGTGTDPGSQPDRWSRQLEDHLKRLHERRARTERQRQAAEDIREKSTDLLDGLSPEEQQQRQQWSRLLDRSDEYETEALDIRRPEQGDELRVVDEWTSPHSEQEGEDAVRGTVTGSPADIARQFEQAREAAERAIEETPLPPRAREAVRRYFLRAMELIEDDGDSDNEAAESGDAEPDASGTDSE